MEGRRRRAQRLTQNTEELPEREAVRQEDMPEGAQEASLPHPVESAPAQTEQSSAPHRRRAAPQIHVQEETVQETRIRETNAQRAPVCKAPAQQTLPAETGKPVAHLEKTEDTQQTAEVRKPKRESRKKPVKVKKRLSAPRRISGDRFRNAVRASAKVGKNAVEGLGGLLLLVLMTASEGFGKLGTAVKRLIRSIQNGKSQKREKHPSAIQEEYELEPIRPEDYHGRGQAHAQKTAAGVHRHQAAAQKRPNAYGKKNKDRQKALLINRLLSALLLCVALFSAWQIGSIVLRSIKTNRLNEELSRERAALIDSQDSPEQEEETAERDGITDIPTPTPAPAQGAATAHIRNTATSVPDVVKTTKYRQLGGDALPEMAALYEKNRDLVAWLQIPDVLDLPVVYRDNNYYLTRDFNKQKNASGTIFLDENHPFKEKTQNLLLHGHNMKDGTMFGRLAQYLYDDTYIRNHPFIYFDTLWDKEQYVIFAMLNVSLDTKNERFFNYFTHDTFSSDTEFQAYIRQLQLRSYYAIPIDVNPSDALLTLSTCLEEDRLVIVARRLRENETRSELRTLIRMTTKQ